MVLVMEGRPCHFQQILFVFIIKSKEKNKSLQLLCYRPSSNTILSHFIHTWPLDL